MELNREDAENAKRKEPSEELDRLAYEVIGAAIEVHRMLGPGFLEEVYHKALKVEFIMGEIPHIYPTFSTNYLQRTFCWGRRIRFSCR
jgi:PD-(D/E)XK nuclease superfamily